jgi:hypothetical protein
VSSPLSRAAHIGRRNTEIRIGCVVPNRRTRKQGNCEAPTILFFGRRVVRIDRPVELKISFCLPSSSWNGVAGDPSSTTQTLDGGRTEGGGGGQNNRVVCLGVFSFA